MRIATGDRLPDVDVFLGAEKGPQKASTSALFAGKKTAFFAVPGAFTPTCSVKHLPGFVTHRAAFEDKGIDQIICMAVNDAFVMGAWAKSARAEGIVMLADGNGAFTKALGLEMDASGFGMGLRAQRFSMLVEDGVVKSLNIEEGGAFEVSSAEHLLSQI